MNCKIELCNSGNVVVSEMERLSKNDLSKIKEQFINEWNEEKYKKILGSLELLVEGQKVTQKDFQLGFIGLAKQNSKLLDLNKELNQQLEIVVSKLNVIKKEREEKAACRKACSNRKRFPKRDPISSEIYNLLMKESEGPGCIVV